MRPMRHDHIGRIGPTPFRPFALCRTKAEGLRSRDFRPIDLRQIAPPTFQREFFPELVYK
jgi:hypothetical protein